MTGCDGSATEYSKDVTGRQRAWTGDKEYSVKSKRDRLMGEREDREKTEQITDRETGRIARWDRDRGLDR